jgi:HTH-type transcriptional regulator/antitoxin HipB
LVFVNGSVNIPARECCSEVLVMANDLKKCNAQEIGQLIRDARTKLGVTQRNLAMTSGTGLRFIIELEQGKPTCQLEKVLTVLKTLGLKLTIEDK